ncbi:MAG: hypothetical protein ACK2UO_10225, partial [Caldilineaceae bacterium]
FDHDMRLASLGRVVGPLYNGQEMVSDYVMVGMIATEVNHRVKVAALFLSGSGRGLNDANAYRLFCFRPGDVSN